MSIWYDQIGLAILASKYKNTSAFRLLTNK